MNSNYFNKYNFSNSPFNYMRYSYNKFTPYNDNIIEFENIKNTTNSNIYSDDDTKTSGKNDFTYSKVDDNDKTRNIKKFFNVLGYNFKIDDIIIIGIVIFLLLEKNTDYLLLIILGLLLLDISSDNIKNIKIIKNLFNT